MKPASDTRKPYGGTARSLVVALDVGTTFSGVSYAILEPGEVPKIHGVTRFPGQEHVAGNSKIPSIMYYDRHGKLKAAGAEAENASVMSQAEDEGWTKAELFKLRLRPKTMKLNMNGMRLGHLPHRKTATDVLGDFLAYLFLCTRNFITDTHANGPALWHAVEHDIQFVLSHPNGWEGAQQAKMRRGAINGGLIPDTDAGKARIRFVTEGEASLHACVLNGLAADVLSNPSRHGFLVADAGGGTLDISSYAIRGTSPLVIEEIAPPDCIFAGSVFVSRRAREFLEKKLQNSKYGTADSLDHITKRFDETTKRLFRDKKDSQFIPFGSPLDKDMAVGIRAGQLRLTGNEVSEFFESSIEAAITSIKAQIDASGGIVKSVWLVGGFAASPWLFSQLQERLAPLNVTVSRPDSQTSKAVADGAIGFYCDHHVSARMSKFMYGVEYLREFNHLDEEHVARRDRLCELPSGPKLLPDAFDCILARSKKVKESTVFSRKYCTELTSLSTLSVFEVEVWCYRGGDVIPPWILRDAEAFSTLCVVRADLSPLSGSAQAKQSKNGKSYWTIVFSIEIHFGLTEFKARIKWVDNGNTKYGPASIIYNESGRRAEEAETESSIDEEVTIRSSRSDRFRSEPSSRLRSRDPYAPVSAAVTPGGRGGPAHGSPKADITFQEIPEVLRSPTTPKSSHTADTGFSRERKYSEKEADKDRERGRSNDKGKEREKAPSRNKGDPSKLADTLTSVWGSSAAPPSPLTGSSSPKGLTSGRASARGGTPSKALRDRELVVTDLVEPPQPTNSSHVGVPPAAISSLPRSPVVEAEVTKAVAVDAEQPVLETTYDQTHEERVKEFKPEEVPDSGVALVAGHLSSHSSPKPPNKSGADDAKPDTPVHPGPAPTAASEQLSATVAEQPAVVSVATDAIPAVSVTSTPKPATATVTPKKKGKKTPKNENVSVEPVSSPKPPPGPGVTLDDSSLQAKKPDADKVDASGTLLATAADGPSSLFSDHLIPPLAWGEAPSPIEAGIFDKLGGVLTPKPASSSPLISGTPKLSTSPKPQLSSPLKTNLLSSTSPNATVADSLPKTSPAVVWDDALAKTEESPTTIAKPDVMTESVAPVTKSESPKATVDVTAAPIIDVTKDAPNVDVPKVDTPKVNALNVDAPNVDMPNFDMPNFDTPNFDTKTNTTEVAPKTDAFDGTFDANTREYSTAWLSAGAPQDDATDDKIKADGPGETFNIDAPDGTPKVDAPEAISGDGVEPDASKDSPIVENNSPDVDTPNDDSFKDIGKRGNTGGNSKKQQKPLSKAQQKKLKKGAGTGAVEQDVEQVAPTVDEIMSPTDKDNEPENEAEGVDSGWEAPLTKAQQKKLKKLKDSGAVDQDVEPAVTTDAVNEVTSPTDNEPENEAEAAGSTWTPPLTKAQQKKLKKLGAGTGAGEQDVEPVVPTVDEAMSPTDKDNENEAEVAGSSWGTPTPGKKGKKKGKR